MSLLEAPCAKTPWRALLFHAILGITGALIVCFDIWWFKQVNNSETGFGGQHCDFEQHVPCFNCACAYEFRKVCIRGARCFYFVGALLFCDIVQTHLEGVLLGRVILIGTLRYLFIYLSIYLFIYYLSIYLLLEIVLGYSLKSLFPKVEWLHFSSKSISIIEGHQMITWHALNSTTVFFICLHSGWQMTHNILVALVAPTWTILNKPIFNSSQCAHNLQMGQMWVDWAQLGDAYSQGISNHGVGLFCWE